MGVAHSLVILGATGLLGQALKREAARRNVPATGVARTNAERTLDVTDGAALSRLLEETRPTVIVNAAAMTALDACERSPGDAYLINARLAALLARHCATHGCRLLQVSTDHYFSGDGQRLHREDATVSLLNEYARTKYAGESFALSNSDSLVVRTNVVGFRRWEGRPTFVEWAIAALRKQDSMTLFDDFYTSSLDVESLASALLDLVDRQARGLLNVAARECSSKRDFILGLARRLNLSTANCRVGSVRKLAGPARAESLGLDVTAAEGVLGYALPGAETVLDRLVQQNEEIRN